MKNREKILTTYKVLQLQNPTLDTELLMYSSIYSHYNFKDNGCPYYEINQIKSRVPGINFEPKYSLFLQDMYDLLFLWVFEYTIMSSRIKIIILTIKINLNIIKFEIYNNKTVEELINLIAEYYNFKTNNLILKKNNLILDNKKTLLEYKLNELSRLTLYFNQFG